MGGILHYDDAMPVGEVDDLFIEGPGGRLTGRAVGVAEHQEFGAGQDVIGDAGQIGEEIVLRHQRQPVDHATKPACGRARDRIAGHRHQRDVAGVDEGRRQHGVGGLRADAVVDLLDGVEADPEFPLHERRHRLLVGRDAVVGIPTVFRTVDLPLHHRADAFGCHFVVLTDAEVEHPPLGMLGESLPLGPLDQFELVDLVALAVARPADALGEKVLKPRVGCCFGGGCRGGGHGARVGWFGRSWNGRFPHMRGTLKGQYRKGRRESDPGHANTR